MTERSRRINVVGWGDKADSDKAAHDVARQSHDSCGRHWRGVLKILAYLDSTSSYGLISSPGERVLSVYCDADYAKRETDTILSGAAVISGGIAISSTSWTKHCVTVSTTEAENEAMAEGAKECMFVRLVLSFLRPRVAQG